MKSNLILLLVMQPGRIQTGLTTMLSVIAMIEDVILADNCMQALNLLQKTCPDIVVIDMDLFHEETLRACLKRCPDLKIIALINRHTQKKLALKVGITSVLYKGFSVADFLREINSLNQN